MTNSTWSKSNDFDGFINIYKYIYVWLSIEVFWQYLPFNYFHINFACGNFYVKKVIKKNINVTNMINNYEYEKVKTKSLLCEN